MRTLVLGLVPWVTYQFGRLSQVLPPSLASVFDPLSLCFCHYSLTMSRKHNLYQQHVQAGESAEQARAAVTRTETKQKEDTGFL